MWDAQWEQLADSGRDTPRKRYRSWPRTVLVISHIIFFRCLVSAKKEGLSLAELSGHGTWSDVPQSAARRLRGSSSPITPIFNLLDQDGLKDYLQGYLSDSSRLEGLKIGEVTKDIKILVFGDSIDQFMTTDACRRPQPGTLVRGKAQGIGENVPSHYLPLTCKYPHFVMTSYRIPGSSKEGPWHTYSNLIWESPFTTVQERVAGCVKERRDMARRVQAIPDFIQANGAPDMVVLSSTLWDLARLHDHTNHTLSGMLAPDVLKDWIDSLHGIMDLIEGYVPPDTLLVYHNAACPRLNSDGETFEFATLERWSILTQMNGASRMAVEEREPWFLLDFEEMAMPFCNNKQYSLLRDRHHPQDWFLLNVLNRYLNAILSPSR